QECLGEAGEGEEWRARHARYFLELAERADPELHGPAQAEWLQRLEEGHDNFRAALDWSLPEGKMQKEKGKTDEDVGPTLLPLSFIILPSHEVGLRLGGALGPFWWMRGYFSEGRNRLEALLAQSGYALQSPEPGSAFRVARPEECARHSERYPPE